MNTSKYHFSLSELINILNIKEVINFKNYTIKNLTHNSKRVQADSLFVVIAGYKFDGHQYISEAIAKGAKAVIGEKKLDLDDNITYILVPDSRIL